MANHRNYKKILGDWQVLYDNLAPRLTDMPLVANDHAALGTILGQARTLQNQQEAANAQLRDINQQRRQIVDQGSDAASRLGHALKSILGTKNEKLIEFGVKPLPRVRKPASRQKKKKTDAAAESAQPTTAPAAPSAPSVGLPTKPPAA